MQPHAVPQVVGRLALDVAYDNVRSRSLLTVREQQPPLQVVRAFTLPDGTALAHLHNIGGGVLGGDQLELQVKVGDRARMQLTTTGATRVYHHRLHAPTAMQINTVYVGEDGLLEYVPDALIPFAGSRYRQRTTVHLAAGAGLFWWETVAPGRSARGEIFAYNLLDLSLDIVAEGRPIAIERLHLEPQQQSLGSLARMGPYRHVTTFYMCKAGVDPARWLALETELAALAQDLTNYQQIVWGVSTLAAHGLVVRSLSMSERMILSGLQAFWRTAKQRLYSQEAVPPHKVY